MHACACRVPGQPGRVTEAAPGARHLVGQTGDACEGQRLFEVGLGAGRVALVQQYGATGAQQIGGLLGGRHLAHVHQPLVQQYQGAQ